MPIHFPNFPLNDSTGGWWLRWNVCLGNPWCLSTVITGLCGYIWWAQRLSLVFAATFGGPMMVTVKCLLGQPMVSVTGYHWIALLRLGWWLRTISPKVMLLYRKCSGLCLALLESCFRRTNTRFQTRPLAANLKTWVLFWVVRFWCLVTSLCSF